MTKEKKDLEAEKIALDSLLNKNKITKREHSKGLCLMVYEYSINGFINESINMYLSINQSYINDLLYEDLAEDRDFFVKLNTWYELLAYSGHVPYDIMATQKGANA
jgi:hypothetical protein